MGVHGATVRRWVDEQGFPACKLPNGEWCTTSTLIDQWILARCKSFRQERDRMEGEKELRARNKINSHRPKATDSPLVVGW